MPKLNSGRVFLGAVVGVLALAVLPLLAAGPELDKADPSSIAAGSTLKARKPEPTYKIQVGMDGEVYPVFANYASLQKPGDRKWGTVAVTVTNSSDATLRQHIAARIEGWSDEEIQIIELRAGEVRTCLFAPAFLPRLYHNREIAAATALVNVRDRSGNLLFTATAPVRLRSADDMYWGRNFKFAPFIASWVTPHEAGVETLLSRAKEFAPGRRLPGYVPGLKPALQARSTYEQVNAIYRALQAQGLSYVKSSLTFGEHSDASERVRMPRESLNQVSANCIDGAVMYASLFENLGMDPVVLLVPGHAYVGVRVAPGSLNYIFIETSLTGRASFAAAVSAAERALHSRRASEVIRIPINSARQAGIYPMPSYTQSAENDLASRR